MTEYRRLVTNLREVGHLDDLAVETLASPVLPEDVVREVRLMLGHLIINQFP